VIEGCELGFGVDCCHGGHMASSGDAGTDGQSAYEQLVWTSHRGSTSIPSVVSICSLLSIL